jgi:hypothetical protein
LSGKTATLFTYKSLGLPEGVDDETLLKTFDTVTSRDSKKGIVLTSDLGKRDGVMPIVAAKHPALAVVTTSVRSSGEQETAFGKLGSHKIFKNLSTYSQRYKKLHVSKHNSTFQATYITIQNKSKQKKLK